MVEPTQTERVTCVKQSFMSDLRARRTAAELARIHRKPPMRPYHCSQCGFWHLTSDGTNASLRRRKSYKR